MTLHTTIQLKNIFPGMRVILPHGGVTATVKDVRYRNTDAPMLTLKGDDGRGWAFSGPPNTRLRLADGDEGCESP